MSFRACAVVPVFNHHSGLGRIAAALAAQSLPVIFVDDGSDAETKHVLAQLADGAAVEVLTLPENRGKGAAVLAGFEHAAARGCTHALQVDADGQHDLDDAAALLALATAHPDHLVSGLPCYDDSVPAVRFYGRYITHALIWLDTLSLRLRDSMCGYRVYPLAPSLALARRVRIGRRMDFDTDIMTRLYWAGTESLFVPTRVRYPEDGVSHYRMGADNARMAWLHLRLFGGMIPRAPKLAYRSLTRLRRRHWARIAESGSLAGLRFLGTLDRLLGRTVSRAIVMPVAVWFYFAHTRARRASRQFLAAAGIAPTLANGVRHFNEFAISILDKVLAWHAPARVPIDFSDCKPLTDAVAARRGVLLLTAHLGNAEAARALAGVMPDLRINALVHTANARKINAMLERTAAEYPLRLIQVADFGAETAWTLRDKILAGEQVVIVGDRTPVAGDAVVNAEFLGRPAPFPIGPYVLAHVLECPVYLFLCVREGRGYKAFVEPFAERIHLPRAGRATAAAQWAGRYARRLEYYARRDPLQWYNFYDFWEGTAAQPRPAGAPLQAAHSGANHG